MFCNLMEPGPALTCAMAVMKHLSSADECLAQRRAAALIGQDLPKQTCKVADSNIACEMHTGDSKNFLCQMLPYARLLWLPGPGCMAMKWHAKASCTCLATIIDNSGKHLAVQNSIAAGRAEQYQLDRNAGCKERGGA